MKLLLDEPPLIVLPSLAKAIGLNEAIVLQQLHYWLQSKRSRKQIEHYKNGRWWVYNSYRKWREDSFPFWSEITIQRIFLSLERSGLVISDYLADEKDDRQKWYSIDYAVYRKKVEAKLDPSSVDAFGHPFDHPDPTASDRQDAPHQVDMVDDIKLMGSIPSTCDGPPDQVDGVFIGAETSAEIYSETTAENAATGGRRRSPSPKVGTAGIAAPAVAAFQASPFPESENVGTPDPADPVLVEELVACDLNRPDALRLAAAKPEECRRQLEFLPFVAEFKVGPGAYLRRAIEENWAPPPAWKQEQKRLQAEVQKAAKAAQAAATAARTGEAQEARAAAIAAERARLQAEGPAAWEALTARAEAGLPPPIRNRPEGPAFAPALAARIDALIAESLGLPTERS